MSEALKKAQEADLDLVLIAPEITPPVAKILDFSKFLYQEKKRKATTKSKKSELKELRFGPSTGESDIKRHIARAKEFVEDGNRVKIAVYMRGRENIYPDIAFEKIERFRTELESIAKMEDKPKRTGRSIWTVFVRK